MAKSKTERAKFGLAGGPIPATQLLVREMDHDFGTPAHACLAINEVEGTFTSFNSYGPKGDKRLGRNYDAEGMTHPLPADGDEKWKKWNKKGYEPAKVPADWDVVKMVTPKVAKPAVAAK